MIQDKDQVKHIEGSIRLTTFLSHMDSFLL